MVRGNRKTQVVVRKGSVRNYLVSGRAVSQDDRDFERTRGRNRNNITSVFCSNKSTNCGRVKVALYEGWIDWLSKNDERSLVRRRIKSLYL